MLRELYYGKLIPWERHYRNDAKQLEIMRKTAEEEKYFEETLTPDDFQRLQALFSMYSKIFELDEYEIYSHGFSAGMLLMQDVINVTKTILPDRRQHK